MTADRWCVTLDLGSFDLIVHESGQYLSCQSYVQNCQHLYNIPLNIMMYSEVRLLVENWGTIEFCHGAEVREPGWIKT